MSDIVERLRQLAHLYAVEPKGHDCWEAADAITTLRAEVGRLKEALEPFAKAADCFDGWPIKNPEEWFAYSGTQTATVQTGAITVGDLRRARAALGERT